MEMLDALPLFLAVAEDRCFSGAARRLGLSRSATGKAVARLEAQLGVALFQRTTRRVRLTEAGEILFERACAIRSEWQTVEARLAETKAQPQGRLRIGLPAIGHRLIAPHLQTFCERYTLLSLDFEQDDRIADLTAGRIDVAIRSGALDDASHHARPLTDFDYRLCAAPDYVARHGLPSRRDELDAHRQIRFRFPGTERLQPWRLAGEEDASHGAPAIVSTNMEGVLAAVLAGLGIAQLPSFLAADDLAAGRLVEMLAGLRPIGRFWLVWPHHLHRTPNVHALVDHLVRAFGPGGEAASKP